MNTLNIDKTLFDTLIDVKTEAKQLYADALKCDIFLGQVIDDIDSVLTLANLTQLDIEKFALLGQAAVRNYQSFDTIPAADYFVELACLLSHEINERAFPD